MPSEIPHLDERFKPKGIRGVDRTEEASFTSIFRNWAVEDCVLGTGTDKGVYLRALHAQREPFSFCVPPVGGESTLFQRKPVQCGL